jgi:hypothetical protein
MMRLAFALVAICCALVTTPAPPAHAQLASEREDIPRRLQTERVWSTAQVAIGPDRFRYLVAYRSRPATAVNVAQFPMKELARTALAQHAGIAVYESSDTAKAYWVFPLGVVSTIATGAWQRTDGTSDINFRRGEELLIGTPSFETIPRQLRDALAEYMRINDHVAVPKIATIIALGNKRPRSAAFMMMPNLSRSDFASRAAWIEEGHRIDWFLPPPYIGVRPTNDDEKAIKALPLLFATVLPLADTANRLPRPLRLRMPDSRLPWLSDR